MSATKIDESKDPIEAILKCIAMANGKSCKISVPKEIFKSLCDQGRQRGEVVGDSMDWIFPTGQTVSIVPGSDWLTEDDGKHGHFVMETKP